MRNLQMLSGIPIGAYPSIDDVISSFSIPYNSPFVLGAVMGGGVPQLEQSYNNLQKVVKYSCPIIERLTNIHDHL